MTNRTRTWHPRGPSADAQIRALLDGTKTQLRLPIKLVQFKPSDTPGYDWCFRGTATGRPTTGTWQDFRKRELVKLSPFGAPGDLLSVRETWAEFTDELTDATQGTVCYAADSTAQWRCKPAATERRANGMSAYFPETAIKWRSPVTMPAWASRLTLLVIDVRVERVQDNSEADAVASGFVADDFPAREFFEFDWDDTWLKAGFGWDANPWVWAANVEKVAK